MARGGSAARRYAEAAFQLAEREDALDRWRDDLRLAASVAADPELSRLVGSPMIAMEEREALVAKALQKRLSKPAFNLVRLLVRRGRLDLVGGISSEYQRLLNQRRGVVQAVITSARKLSAEEDKAIRARVAEMTGAKVDVTTVVDENLIGGLTVRIGDRLIDSSVRGRLQRLREQLLTGARIGG
jgi:F-type H+-transporting ATPase subunit delta